MVLTGTPAIFVLFLMTSFILWIALLQLIAVVEKLAASKNSDYLIVALAIIISATLFGSINIAML